MTDAPKTTATEYAELLFVARREGETVTATRRGAALFAAMEALAHG